MRRECAAAAARYRLAVPRGIFAGRAGERLGRGSGASLEFMDFRDYAPGDDLRHVDWRGFARTDQLKVRLYREEVSATLDVVADTSASMAVSEAKAQALRDVVDAITDCAERAGVNVRRLACGGGVVAHADELRPHGAEPPQLPVLPLRPRGLRLVVSDFLVPGDPAPLVRRLAIGAAHVFVVQLLDAAELSPEPGGQLTLVDCETGERCDVELDATALAAYRERLQRLQAAVEAATRAAGGTFALLRADEPASLLAQLLARGVVEPA